MTERKAKAEAREKATAKVGFLPPRRGQGQDEEMSGSRDADLRVLKAFGGAEGADYFGGVAVLGVYGEVHGSHVVGGDFVGQAG